MLGNRGTDFSTFQAHNTRYTSTFSAARRRINTDIIREATSWIEKPRMFAKVFSNSLQVANHVL